ncbi:JAB domain-containing protein [Acetobacter nitrogenifigens]|uniref:DNA repair protein RadC n=1 Tax=Acetobacter nitrogenifigens DSM 23921 = NBRC 105050 TaxID=1120919 RepID=A0A511XD93_9PROT|nr:DNA repair protein RadC [Acetobacter nitrogenifigens]GEN60929.1 DNA repair protein RadC [Acetobacter nitrogenifigens DSM 23921 = NBRC 105050]
MTKTAGGFADMRIAPQKADYAIGHLPHARPSGNTEASLWSERVPPPCDSYGEPALPAEAWRRLLDDTAPPADDVSALAAIISLAMPRNERPEALAGTLVSRFGSLAAVLTASEQALRSVAGVGSHLISALCVVRDAALRVHRAGLQDIDVLSNRERLYAYLSAVLARETIEQFRVLFLGSDDRLIADEAQARGTVNHTPVYPREVVRRALEVGAVCIVLVHNHPSGDPTPSQDDVAMTRQVTSAAAVLGLTVRDHIIVGNGRWLSFSDAGLL